MATGTYDWTTDAYPGQWNVDRQNTGADPVVVARFIDCTVTPMVAGSYKLIKIPAGAIVKSVHIVPTVSEATDVVEVGNATTHDVYRSGAVLASGTNTHYVTHAYFSAANEVQITTDGTLDTGKFWIIMEFLPITNNV